MTEIVVYSKEGCSLCEKAIDTIGKLAKKHPLNVKVIDIAGDEELCGKYGTLVPVVIIDGKIELHSKVDEKTLEEILGRL